LKRGCPEGGEGSRQWLPRNINDDANANGLDGSRKKIKENNEAHQHISFDEYELCGVVNHIGETIQRGHYIAYCRGLTNSDEWYRFDDESVDLLKGQRCYVDHKAYILFYEKKKS
jgi:ubiquitin C-terminal hydrolase